MFATTFGKFMQIDLLTITAVRFWQNCDKIKRKS